MAKITMELPSVQHAAVVAEALRRMRAQEVKFLNAAQATREEKNESEDKITMIDQIFGMGIA